MGYLEYLRFCKDIGAEPLPVIAAKVPCQYSATGGAGQQGGAPNVRDSKTDDLIVKLTNLLPVEVNTQIKLEGLSGIKPSATPRVLTGNPGDRKVTPASRAISVSNHFNISLPANSFTLIRLKTIPSK